MWWDGDIIIEAQHAAQRPTTLNGPPPAGDAIKVWAPQPRVRALHRAFDYQGSKLGAADSVVHEHAAVVDGPALTLGILRASNACTPSLSLVSVSRCQMFDVLGAAFTYYRKGTTNAYPTHRCCRRLRRAVRRL